jgi:hypothetical protein
MPRSCYLSLSKKLKTTTVYVFFIRLTKIIEKHVNNYNSLTQTIREVKVKLSLYGPVEALRVARG